MSLDPHAAVLPTAIYDALRAGIIAQSEAPGTTLTESAVALRFGVTRPTAKLAIERLVAEGLLHREAHRAAWVPELTRDDIRDLYDNRAIVEVAAVATLARGGAVPADVISAHRALLAHAADGAFAPHDIAFHRALVAGQPSPRLARMHAQLMGEVELCIGQVQAHHLLSATDIADQHQAILDAITAADAALASTLIHEHIAGARDVLISHYNNTHGAE